MLVDLDQTALRVYGHISMSFCQFYSKGDDSDDFLFASLNNKTSKKESTLSGKNLFLKEQILSFNLFLPGNL